MAEGPGGHALKENIEQQNRPVNWPFNWLFRGKGADARKTVTFGDAAEVSGALPWTVASLVVIILVWFIATTVWGLPSEWSDYADEVRAGLEEDESYRQRALLRDCDQSADNPEDFPGLPACSYTQWLSESTLPSPVQVWDAAWDFARNGYSGFTLWQHLWLSFSRLAKGLFWGVAIGVPIGLAMGLSNRWRGFFDPVVELLRPIPPLALIPLVHHLVRHRRGGQGQPVAVRGHMDHGDRGALGGAGGEHHQGSCRLFAGRVEAAGAAPCHPAQRAA